jgi:two-component system response regulator MtrA
MNQSTSAGVIERRAPRGRVLVVDDDEAIREIIGIVLRDEGLEVSFARDGVEALEIAAEQPHPALVLLDLMMPRLNGRAFVQELRSRQGLQAIPVIIMSGESQAEQTAGGLGVAACLTKPVELDDLVAAVRDALSRAACASDEL